MDNLDNDSLIEIFRYNILDDKTLSNISQVQRRFRDCVLRALEVESKEIKITQIILFHHQDGYDSQVPPNDETMERKFTINIIGEYTDLEINNILTRTPSFCESGFVEGEDGIVDLTKLFCLLASYTIFLETKERFLTISDIEEVRKNITDVFSNSNDHSNMLNNTADLVSNIGNFCDEMVLLNEHISLEKKIIEDYTIIVQIIDFRYPDIPRVYRCENLTYLQDIINDIMKTTK